jgi:hypothetical protein
MHVSKSHYRTNPYYPNAQEVHGGGLRRATHGKRRQVTMQERLIYNNMQAERDEDATESADDDSEEFQQQLDRFKKQDVAGLLAMMKAKNGNTTWCSWCQHLIEDNEAAEMDHDQAASQGGQTELNNINWLHRKCNNQKSILPLVCSKKNQRAWWEQNKLRDARLNRAAENKAEADKAAATKAAAAAAVVAAADAGAEEAPSQHGSPAVGLLPSPAASPSASAAVAAAAAAGAEGAEQPPVLPSPSAAAAAAGTAAYARAMLQGDAMAAQQVGLIRAEFPAALGIDPLLHAPAHPLDFE